MLFSHMSLWAIGLFLLVLFVAKHYFVGWVLRTDFAESRTAGQGWVGAIATNVVVNAALTFAILFVFAGFWWAVILALIDAVIHYLLGYWKKRQHLPAVNTQSMLNVYSVVSFIHTNSYIGIIAFVLKYLWPHSPLVQAMGAATK